MLFKIQEFFLAVGLIKRKEWGYIIITSIVLTPVTGFFMFIFFWVRTYMRWSKMAR